MRSITKVIVRDINKLTPEDIQNLPVPDMTYTDPPWGQANLTAWSTKAHIPRQDWRIFLSNLIHLVKRTRGAVYIEMGNTWLPDLINEIQAQQGTIIKVWNITYYKTRPCKLILATWHAKEIQYPDYTGLDDKETPYLAIQYSTKTTDLIFDPCTGLGTTLKAAQHHNRNFLGIELNSHRASTLTDKTLQTETQRDGP